MKKQAVLFDLDGTLLDTLADLAASANRSLAALGLPTHPESAYRCFVGDGLQTLVERILPEGERQEAMIDKVAAAFLEDYAEHWRDKTRPYPGVEEMLSLLEQQGLRLAVLSNKPESFTRLCVRELLAGHDFFPVFGQKEGRPKKPDPAGALEVARELDLDPAAFLYLGDTATDMRTALAAGMTPVGALWGFRTREELLESGARHLLSRPTELVGLAAG